MRQNRSQGKQRTDTIREAELHATGTQGNTLSELL